MKASSSEFNGGKGKIVDEVKSMANEAEEFVHNTARAASESMSAARGKLQDTYQATKDDLVKAERLVAEKSKQAATATTEYMQGNPWRSVGIAGGVGLLIGYLLTRR